MQIVSQDDNLLAELQGKQISVKVDFGDVVDGVSYARNGDAGVITKGQTYNFPLQANCILTLQFTFAGAADGTYRVEISGDGGDTFRRTYTRSFGIPTDAKNYDFRTL